MSGVIVFSLGFRIEVDHGIYLIYFGWKILLGPLGHSSTVLLCQTVCRVSPEACNSKPNFEYQPVFSRNLCAQGRLSTCRSCGPLMHNVMDGALYLRAKMARRS